MNVKVEGDTELRAKLKVLGEAYAHQRLKLIVYEAADMIRNAAERIYNSQRKGHGKDPGNLANHMLVEMTKKSDKAAAWFKNKARHAHLFEFGHVLWTGGRRRKGKGRVRGIVRGYPFFRPAVDEQRAAVRQHIRERLVKLLDEAARASGMRNG